MSNQDEMKKLCKGLPKDAFFQVWFHLAKQTSFTGEEFFISANQKQEFPMAAMFVVQSG